MEITDIRIRKVEDNVKLKAVVAVTFDNELVVHDIKIIELESKTLICMPSRKTPSGEFKDIVHPTNQSARTKLQTAILEKYDSLD